MCSNVVTESRLPPQNIDFEKQILSAIIIGADVDCIADVIPILKSNHFYRQHHRLIYEAMLHLYEQGFKCELTAIHEYLVRRCWLDKIGGADYLSVVLQAAVSTANVQYYAAVVRDLAVLRNLISSGTNIVNAAYDPEADPHEVIESAEKWILNATQDFVQSDTVDMKMAAEQVVNDVINRKQGHIRGLATGYRKIDDKLHGLKGGDFVVIGARASMGKTSFATNIADHFAIELEAPVAIFSLEMTADSLIERLLSSRARVSSHAMSGGFLGQTDVDALKKAAGEIASAPIFIEQSQYLTPLLLRTRTRRLVSHHGLKCVILDYLQLLHLSGKVRDRYLEIGEITYNACRLPLKGFSLRYPRLTARLKAA